MIWSNTISWSEQQHCNLMLLPEWSEVDVQWPLQFETYFQCQLRYGMAWTAAIEVVLSGDSYHRINGLAFCTYNSFSKTF